MCNGKPYHTPGKKQRDYQQSWYHCIECGVIIGHQNNPYIKCSNCGGRLDNYVCEKCGYDFSADFSCPVDFDAIP